MKRSDIADSVVVVACWAAASRESDSLETLRHLTGAPEKVAIAAMERAMGRGLIDCGVSLATAWPTIEGLKLKRPSAGETHQFDG